jgi:hypothetical protein
MSKCKKLKSLKSYSAIEKSEGSEIAMTIAIERHKFYLGNRERFETVYSANGLIEAQERREKRYQQQQKETARQLRENSRLDAEEKRSKALAIATARIQADPRFLITE